MFRQGPNRRPAPQGGGPRRVGVDNVDVPTATARGVVVMNTPFATPPAPRAHRGMLMALARNIPRADQKLRSGDWDKKSFTGVELEGKNPRGGGPRQDRPERWPGRAGPRDARAGFRPLRHRERAAELGVELAGLDAILAQADFLTLHVPLNDKTRNLIDAKALARMKPAARIVNVSRGGWSTRPPARRAQGPEAGRRALDVFSREPITDSPLFGLPNVVVTRTSAPRPRRPRSASPKTWPASS